jgi:hypothetical protein
MIKWIKNRIDKWKRKRARKRRLEELKKQDPFIYD